MGYSTVGIFLHNSRVQRGKFAYTDEEKWIKGKRESGEADEEADDASQPMSESESEEEEE